MISSTILRTEVRAPLPMSIVLPSSPGLRGGDVCACHILGVHAVEQALTRAELRAAAIEQGRDHMRNQERRPLVRSVHVLGSEDHHGVPNTAWNIRPHALDAHREAP
jgi:hypothetical protein